MVRINNQDVEAFTLSTLSAGQVAIPADTRQRLQVREGQLIRIGNRTYEVTKAPLSSIRSLERRRISQDNMVFFRNVPAESRVVAPAPAPIPAPAVATAPTPAVREPVREEAPEEPTIVLPRTRVNGKDMVLCVGHNMIGTDVDGNIVRLPAAARAVLSVNRGDRLTINGREFNVHESFRTDLEQYTPYFEMAGPSEILFLHPRSILESDTVFDVARVSMHLPITDEVEARRLCREKIDEIVGTDLSQDIDIECTVQDGLVSVKLKYLPGVEAITEAPANLNSALASVASILQTQLDQMVAGITSLKQRLQRI